MNFNLSRWILFILLICLSLHGVSAQISQAPVPTWLRTITKQPIVPNLEDISEGYYYELIDYQVNVFEKSRFYKSTKVLFDSNGAENAGQLYVQYDPKYQRLILHELKIVRDGQELNRLNPQAFQTLAVETDLSRSIYNGMHSAYYVLEDLRQGDKIVFSYSVEGFNPVFEDKFFDSYYLQGYEPVGLLHLHYVIPQNRKITFKSHKGASEVQAVRVGSHTSYFWEETHAERVIYDDYSPFWFTKLRWIECSEFSSWNEVADWNNRINPVQQIKPGSALYTFVEKVWKEAKGDPYRFLTSATDFVQNEIRYMGIEVGEYSHRANLPEKVFNQRYGDCKDKSVLLASILHSKNIRSALVLANTYKEYGLTEYLPSPTAFNHMVICVSINDRLQYIDPTITNQGGHIKDRFFPYYGSVLRSDDAKNLVTIQKEGNSKTSIVETYRLEGEGEAILTVKTDYLGGSADYIRQYFKNNAKNQIQKSYLDYYAKLHDKITKEESLTFEDDKVNNIFVVHEKYRIKEIGKVEEGIKKKILPLYANHISEKLPEPTRDRESPISLEFPLNLEYDIHIINPNGKSVGYFNDNIFFDRETYHFGKNLRSHGDTIKISYRLGLHDTYIPVKQIETYFSDFGNRDNLFYNGFYLEEDGSLIGNNRTIGNWNFWAILLFIVLIVSSLLFFRKYNRSTASSIIPLYEETTYDTVGGWLIVLLIGLVSSAFRQLANLFAYPSFFSTDTWTADLYLQGVSAYFYRTLVATEFAFNTLLLLGFIYCSYLLIKKRDIFPQTLFILLIGMIVFNVIDNLVAHYILGEYVDKEEAWGGVVQSLIFASIWGTYLYRSERVKGTFTVPYAYKEDKNMSRGEIEKDNIEA